MVDNKINKYVLHFILIIIICVFVYLSFVNVEGFQAGGLQLPIVGTPAQQAWTTPYINTITRPLPSWASPSQIALNDTIIDIQSRIIPIANELNLSLVQGPMSKFLNNVSSEFGKQIAGLSDSDLLDRMQSVAITNGNILLSTLQSIKARPAWLLEYEQSRYDTLPSWATQAQRTMNENIINLKNAIENGIRILRNNPLAQAEFNGVMSIFNPSKIADIFQSAGTSGLTDSLMLDQIQQSSFNELTSFHTQIVVLLNKYNVAETGPTGTSISGPPWLVAYDQSKYETLPTWATQAQITVNNNLKSQMNAVLNMSLALTNSPGQAELSVLHDKYPYTTFNNIFQTASTSGLSDSLMLDQVQQSLLTLQSQMIADLTVLMNKYNLSAGTEDLRARIETIVLSDGSKMPILTSPTGTVMQVESRLVSSPSLNSGLGPGSMLLQSIVGSSPPAGVTPAQIQTAKKYWNNLQGINVTARKSNNAMDDVLASAIESAYSSTNTVSQNATAITNALHKYITSGQAANYVNPQIPTITDTTLLALINDSSWISTTNLPKWIVPGTSQSWMTSGQLSQFNTLQIKASTIPSMTNASIILGLLLARMRISYIKQKLGNSSATDSQIFDPVMEDVLAFFNSFPYSFRDYGSIPTAPTDTVAPNSWPSFTGVTLPEKFIEVKNGINKVVGLTIIEKIERNYDSFLYLISNPTDSDNNTFKYATANARPPPAKNVQATSSIPVGIKVVCKLSDINALMQIYFPKGSIIDPMVTPAQYATAIAAIPQGGVISIIDASSGNIIWDPITTFRNNATIVPFPNTTTVGTYIFYTNAGKFTYLEAPIQQQSDKNIIDRIIYNILDTFVGLANLDKSSSIYQNILSGYNIQPKVLDALSAINSFKFQNIVYETYSQVVEDFQNPGSVDIYKLYNKDGTPVFTNNNSLYMGIAGLTILSISGYFLYRFLRQRKIKYVK